MTAETLLQGAVGLLVLIIGWNVARLYGELDRTRQRMHMMENNYAGIITWLRIKFPMIDNELKMRERDGE